MNFAAVNADLFLGFFENIKLSVAEGVLMALEQYNNGNQNNERPSE